MAQNTNLTSISSDNANSLIDVERRPSSGISVLIVGAGVAGVMSALECWRKGHNVRILERSPGPDAAGLYSTACLKMYIGNPNCNSRGLFHHWSECYSGNQKVAFYGRRE